MPGLLPFEGRLVVSLDTAPPAGMAEDALPDDPDDPDTSQPLSLGQHDGDIPMLRVGPLPNDVPVSATYAD